MQFWHFSCWIFVTDVCFKIHCQTISNLKQCLQLCQIFLNWGYSWFLKLFWVTFWKNAKRESWVTSVDYWITCCWLIFKRFWFLICILLNIIEKAFYFGVLILFHDSEFWYVLVRNWILKYFDGIFKQLILIEFLICFTLLYVKLLLQMFNIASSEIRLLEDISKHWLVKACTYQLLFN